MSDNNMNVFSLFCGNLSIPEETIETISKRLHTITKRINIDYWDSTSETDHCLVVGSYGRGTAIKASDIDVVIELPRSEYNRFNDYTWNGQSSFLQSIKESIKKTYSTSDVSGDGQVVDIVFSDGIKFEIVPSFRHKDGSYTYADSNKGGHWKSMQPSLEMLLFSYYDSLYEGNLRRLCRMARAWKQKHTVLLPGILIDTIACDFLDQYEYAKESWIYYDWISRDFFKYIVDQGTKSKWNRIVAGETITVQHMYSVHNDAKKAYELACKAIATNSNCEYQQREYWREIYGDEFPR